MSLALGRAWQGSGGWTTDLKRLRQLAREVACAGGWDVTGWDAMAAGEGSEEVEGVSRSEGAG